MTCESRGVENLRFDDKHSGQCHFIQFKHSGQCHFNQSNFTRNFNQRKKLESICFLVYIVKKNTRELKKLSEQERIDVFSEHPSLN